MVMDVSSHSKYDKSFMVHSKHLQLEVDYDDVNHAEVDAAVEQIRRIVAKHWNPEVHKQLLKEILMAQWNKNESNLQNDYEGNVEDYLKSNGL